MALRIPSGTRDVLPEEMAALRRIEQALLATFLEHGFGEVSTPTVEYEDTLRAAEIGLGPAYRVVDDHGELLALRADMTVPIARVVATRYADSEPPLRFCYAARAHRAVRPHRGQAREFLQAGVELFGVPGAAGTAEVLTVLSRALEAAGLREFHLGLGDARIYPSLLSAFDVPEDGRAKLLAELTTRDLAGLDRELLALDLTPEARELLSRVPRMRGSAQVLEGLPVHVADAVADLREILSLLPVDVAGRVIVDLGRAPRLGYYSGHVFEVYDPALGEPLGGGGRYDQLLGRFGREMPAVGFALGVDLLHEALAGEARGETRLGGQGS
ncbi:unannotated protein [freshwater metagenome]|uniref:Unannotated protein n=1 Tax=freshwater metagenome TaxID=449393 RepID=A0A6J7I4W5_9ZZZZ|nr:ATP phosphoribosyltransferase regulatory subunit [Actinomycetota bacterium]